MLPPQDTPLTSSSQVEFVGSKITRVTPDGIQTPDGKHIDVDVIICATGEILLFPQKAK